MKASELRIGNLLKAKKDYHNQFHGNGIVSSIEESKFVILDHYPGKWFEPIPLTEEWLLKFRFKLAGDFTNTRVLNVVKHAYDCSEIRYSPNEGLLRFSNGGIKGSTIIPYVKHVHQLQNLYFALTGEELTLNQES